MTHYEANDEIFEAVAEVFDDLKKEDPDTISLDKFNDKISQYIEKKYPNKRFLVEVDEIQIDLKNQCEVYSTANVLNKGIFKRYDFVYREYLYVVHIFIPYANLKEEYSGKFVAVIN